MTELEQAVLRTLAYADLFDQVLSRRELAQWLIGYQLDGSTHRLDELQAPGIQRQGDLWALRGREYLFADKPKQLRATQGKLQTAKRLKWLFRLVPWVKLVAVTGSVAGGSPREHDDIDMLIVVAPRRLWLSRLWLTLVLSLLGKRRRPTDDPQQVPDKFCLNMWLTSGRLVTEHQDIYVANELARMVPVVDRDGMYAHYLKANEWMLEYLPNFTIEVGKREAEGGEEFESSAWKPDEGKRQPVKSKKVFMLSHFLDWLDYQAEQLQRQHMRQVTRETVEDDLLMFHPIDYRQQVLQRYEQRLRELDL